MLFVVDRATQAKKLQQIAEGDDNCQHLSDASKVRTVGACAIGRPDHLHPPPPYPLRCPSARAFISPLAGSHPASSGHCQALAPPPELKALMQMAKTVQSAAQLETNPATPTCMDISGYTRIESAYACAEALGLNPAEVVAPKSKGGFIHEGSGKTLPCGCMKGTELHGNQDQHLFVPYLSGCVDETSCFASGYNCICQPDSSVTAATPAPHGRASFRSGGRFRSSRGQRCGRRVPFDFDGGDAKMISTFTYKSLTTPTWEKFFPCVCWRARVRPRTSSLGSTPALESAADSTHRPQGRVHQTQGCGRQPVMPPRGAAEEGHLPTHTHY